MNFTQPDGSLLFPFAPNHDFPGYQEFLQAYCIAPPDDVCGEIGRCPNFDAAGILVRAAAYASNFFMGLIIVYSPKAAANSFWGLMLFVYSLLITSSISIAQRGLTRFHASITAELAGSPMLFILFFYVLLGLIGRYEHRMSHVLGQRHGQWPANLAVFGSMAWWIALMVFVVRRSNEDFFAQTACDEDVLYERISLITLILPYAGVGLLIWKAIQWKDATVMIEASPVAPLFIVIVVLLIWRRQEIRVLGDGKFRWWNAWRYISEQYPFVHFLAAIFFNFTYWLLVIEGRLDGSHDNHFVLSFGQILAVFATIQPLFQSLMLLPRMGRWFVDLAWVRFLTCRRQKASRVHKLLDDPDAALPFRRSRKDTGASFHSQSISEGNAFMEQMQYVKHSDPWATQATYGLGSGGKRYDLPH